jgi:hypothetical protein
MSFTRMYQDLRNIFVIVLIIACVLGYIITLVRFLLALATIAGFT